MVKRFDPTSEARAVKKGYRRFLSAIGQHLVIKELGELVGDYDDFLYRHLERRLFPLVQNKPHGTSMVTKELLRYSALIQKSGDPLMKRWTKHIDKGMDYFLKEPWLARFFCLSACGRCNYSRCFFGGRCCCEEPLSDSWILKKAYEARRIRRRKDRNRLYR